MKFTKKGFTLIELLVVIAIIGILATIVLVSLNSARNKANDVAIKAAVEQSRAVAELIYDDGGNVYTGLCSGALLNLAHATYGAQLTQISASVDSNNGATGGVPVCSTNGSAYCVSGVLKTTGSFCVDSTGKTSTNVCAANVCP